MIHPSANPQRAALIVMAKRPFPGQTKTRLSPPFSKEEAAHLYECFLRDSLELAMSFPGVTPFIAYSPLEAEDYFRKLAPRATLIPQCGATLGERLEYVLTHCLQAGFKHVAAMNSDSPNLPANYLEKAFDQLADESIDVVLGPCEDGGYYLIGWKQPYPKLVRELEMSTHHVLDDTLAIAAAEKLRIALLPTWYDIDNVADLRRMWPDLTDTSRSGRYTRRFLANYARLAKNSSVDQANTGVRS